MNVSCKLHPPTTPCAKLDEHEHVPLLGQHCSLALKSLMVDTKSLQGRARTVGQVLLGYFEVPFNMDDPVNIAINPTGGAARSATR